MAQRLENLIKSVGTILGERKRLARVEKKVVTALNRALGKIGYKVIHAKAAAPVRRRRRRGRRAIGARRARRRMRTRRGRPRAQKA